MNKDHNLAPSVCERPTPRSVCLFQPVHGPRHRDPPEHTPPLQRPPMTVPGTAALRGASVLFLLVALAGTAAGDTAAAPASTTSCPEHSFFDAHKVAPTTPTNPTPAMWGFPVAARLTSTAAGRLPGVLLPALPHRPFPPEVCQGEHGGRPLQGVHVCAAATRHVCHGGAAVPDGQLPLGVRAGVFQGA